jgi:hypothetical protein
MTPDEINSKFADHDRWFAEMRATIQLTTDLANSNTNAIQLTTDLANSNARVIQSLCDLAAEDREERKAIIARTDEMLADIRGLQAENRRILDILLNNQNNSN